MKRLEIARTAGRGSNTKGNDMLVLSRKTSERILIGDDIAITIVRIGAVTVHIGIDAPAEVRIVREELVKNES